MVSLYYNLYFSILNRLAYRILGDVRCRRSLLPGAILTLARPVVRAVGRRVIQGSPGPTRPLRLAPVRVRRIADRYNSTTITDNSEVTDIEFDGSTRISQDGNDGAINNQSGGTVGNLSVNIHVATTPSSSRFRNMRRRTQFRRQRPLYETYDYYNYNDYYTYSPSRSYPRRHSHPRRPYTTLSTSTVRKPTSPTTTTTTSESKIAIAPLPTNIHNSPRALVDYSNPNVHVDSSGSRPKNEEVLQQLLSRGFLTSEEIDRFKMNTNIDVPDAVGRSRRSIESVDPLASDSFMSKTSLDKPITIALVDHDDTRQSDSEYMQNYAHQLEQQFWLDITPIIEHYSGILGISVSTYVPSFTPKTSHERHKRSINQHVTSDGSDTTIETRPSSYVYEIRNRTHVTVAKRNYSYESHTATYRFSNLAVTVTVTGILFACALIFVVYNRCK